MRDRKKYMYINFQQIGVCRSGKTVHTNIFAQYGTLHKHVYYFRHASS